MQIHSEAFFVKSSAFTFSSDWENRYCFFTFMRKRDNGTWEKPSKREGLTIKMSMMEMVEILEVLDREAKEFSTVHTYKDNSTSIKLNWSNIKGKEILWINVANYKFPMMRAVSLIFRDLLRHCYEEKLEHATGKTDTPQEKKQTTKQKPQPKLQSGNKVQATQGKVSDDDDDVVTLNVQIAGNTQKAILIAYKDQETWIPKSCVHSNFNPDNNRKQKLTIAKWVLKKNYPDIDFDSVSDDSEVTEYESEEDLYADWADELDL